MDLEKLYEACYIGVLVKDVEYAPLAFGISLPLVFFAWILFILIRYTRPAAVKVGSAIALSGAFAFFAPSVVGLLIGSPLPLPRLNGFSSFDSNVKWAVLIVSLIAGIVLITAGIFRRKKDLNK